MILLLNFELEEASLKEVPDPHTHFRWIERFHQQVGGAGGEGAAFVFRGRIAGENEHGDLFVLPIGSQGIENFEAA